MDHGIYEYQPINKRPPLDFEGKKVAAFVLLHLEYWELFPPAGSYREPRLLGEFRTGTFSPEVRNWSVREYGNRVGIYRLLDLFDELGIAPTVALGAAIIQTHPEVVDEVIKRGWEIVTHGFSGNQMMTSKMSLNEQRTFITTCQAMIADAIGKKTEGWLSQDFGITADTSDLLSEAGFRYTLDWANDALPYWQNANGQGRGLISVPGPSEIDDVQMLTMRQFPVDRFCDLVCDMIDGAGELPHSTVFPIGVHPWVMGTAHRFPHLRNTLRELRSRNEVFLTTSGDIARRFEISSTTKGY